MAISPLRARPCSRRRRNFPRYSDIRIVIDDPELAHEEIAGLFRANDPVGFAETIAISLNAHARVGEGEVRLTPLNGAYKKVKSVWRNFGSPPRLGSRESPRWETLTQPLGGIHGLEDQAPAGVRCRLCCTAQCRCRSATAHHQCSFRRSRQIHPRIRAPGKYPDHRAGRQLHGIKTPAVSGNMEVGAALGNLLAGTGLEVARNDGATIILRRGVPASTFTMLADQGGGGSSASAAAPVESVVVTGSRVISDAANSPTPLTIVSTADLLATSPANIPEGLNKLPIFQGSQSIGRPGDGQAELCQQYAEPAQFRRPAHPGPAGQSPRRALQRRRHGRYRHPAAAADFTGGYRHRRRERRLWLRRGDRRGQLRPQQEVRGLQDRRQYRHLHLCRRHELQYRRGGGHRAVRRPRPLRSRAGISSPRSRQPVRQALWSGRQLRGAGGHGHRRQSLHHYRQWPPAQLRLWRSGAGLRAVLRHGARQVSSASARTCSSSR